MQEVRNDIAIASGTTFFNVFQCDQMEYVSFQLLFNALSFTTIFLFQTHNNALYSKISIQI